MVRAPIARRIGLGRAAQGQRAKIIESSANALNSSALPHGSRKNIVACSPGSPLKRMCGSMMKRVDVRGGKLVKVTLP